VQVVTRANLETASLREALRIVGGLRALELGGRPRERAVRVGHGVLGTDNSLRRDRALGGQAQLELLELHRPPPDVLDSAVELVELRQLDPDRLVRTLELAQDGNALVVRHQDGVTR
jgi:hypothetical protein